MPGSHKQPPHTYINTRRLRICNAHYVQVLILPATCMKKPAARQPASRCCASTCANAHQPSSCMPSACCLSNHNHCDLLKHGLHASPLPDPSVKALGWVLTPNRFQDSQSCFSLALPARTSLRPPYPANSPLSRPGTCASCLSHASSLACTSLLHKPPSFTSKLLVPLQGMANCMPRCPTSHVSHGPCHTRA